MNTENHGLSIGIRRVNSDFFLTLKASGKLTHEDYEIITPMIDSALTEVKQPAIRVFIDGTELDGWEPRAAWDDFKLGLKHSNQFEKIAIFGNKGWQKMTAKVGAWFVSGEVKYFESEEAALIWLSE
ncbi:STAS/SEC14 domain-containing protein [Lacimicrobium alkaliphilum]|uniref:STAS/SEC14 domain-containing protein n=1 Tax=Lacimicrobium alkaliphilum TaxID=1526571 RepID=A0ABQ1QXQ5_9ALTE|nr:STAS/SEC14 domain-containing protein [Lacimicrobium alkaliphilum]GGD49059.1 STAS/SEC14 domain-containing protein [Lacimicrobium alkaliphilum]